MIWKFIQKAPQSTSKPAQEARDMPDDDISDFISELSKDTVVSAWVSKPRETPLDQTGE